MGSCGRMSGTSMARASRRSIQPATTPRVYAERGYRGLLHNHRRPLSHVQRLRALQQAGITPSYNKRYTLAQLHQATKDKWGKEANVQMPKWSAQRGVGVLPYQRQVDQCAGVCTERALRVTIGAPLRAFGICPSDDRLSSHSLHTHRTADDGTSTFMTMRAFCKQCCVRERGLYVRFL